ncbi:protein of unknown function [Streptantibioticus cattleyicolor NRRL 8057 = DSM 46488]|nr:protein of unknown function [Streptantibioticus cattleyicolor NRRL 8057 = DSM 46488]
MGSVGAETLARLTAMIPPGVTPRPKHWATVEVRLGTPLPRDYKELIDTYGGGQFDFHISLLEPDPQNGLYDLLEDNDGLVISLKGSGRSDWRSRRNFGSTAAASSPGPPPTTGGTCTGWYVRARTPSTGR